MLLTNIETIPGKTIAVCHGVVSGSSVRSKHVGRDIMAGLKNIVGGELRGYTELLEESREQATERMKAKVSEEKPRLTISGTPYSLVTGYMTPASASSRETSACWR